MAQLPHTLIEQSTSDPPAVVGSQFAADVIKRERQCILVVREYVTLFTSTVILPNEQHQSLREGLIMSTLDIRPMDGPYAAIRVDSAPGFQVLENNELLQKCRLSVEGGRRKNKNKNPVAERAVQEVEDELLKLDPRGNAVSQSMLSIATSNLNAKIRSRGLSAREMLYQRDQFSNIQIPVSDEQLINSQHEAKLDNHKFSEISKAPYRKIPPKCSAKVGDLVYVKSDKSKGKARERYLVISEEGDWLSIRKFTSTQLRAFAYRVKRSEVYSVPYPPDKPLRPKTDNECDEADDFPQDMDEADNENMRRISHNDQLKDSSDQLDQHSSPCHDIPNKLPLSLVVSDCALVPTQSSNHPEPPALPAIPHEIDMPDQSDSENNNQSLHVPIDNTRPKRTVKPIDRLTIEW